jgi:phage terminase small subunit
MARGKAKSTEVALVEKGDLPDRRDLFVMHYAIERNATAAAKLAGYSAKSAHNQGDRLLKDPEIREQIIKRCYEMAKKLDITAEMVLKELATIAFAPLIADGLVTAAAKTRALELLGEHFQLWTAPERGSGGRVITIQVTNIDMRTL